MTQQLMTIIQEADSLSVEEQLTLIEHLAQNVKAAGGQGKLKIQLTEEAKTPSANKSIWQIAADFSKDLPEEVLAQLPSDGAVEHDHYIYGTPKISDSTQL